MEKKYSAEVVIFLKVFCHDGVESVELGPCVTQWVKKSLKKIRLLT